MILLFVMRLVVLGCCEDEVVTSFVEVLSTFVSGGGELNVLEPPTTVRRGGDDIVVLVVVDLFTIFSVRVDNGLPFELNVPIPAPVEDDRDG